MSGLMGDARKSVTDFKSELLYMRGKALNINKGICNLDDVIGTIQASTQIQEEKIASMEAVQRETERFVAETVRIDCGVADVVRQRKDDFYERFSYLKPESEKSGWEKFCEGCKKAWEWCKEHWAMVVTILVVVAIAVIAVAVLHVAVAAVAAIAGIVSLVLFVADTICMIATGGKGLSDIFREKGWNVLADIFQGLEAGCDIVSILLPAGAALKAMSKIGVKSFAKASLKALKTAFKETWEALWKKGFKMGFKDGMKNLGKFVFKTFIFDIDDLMQVRDGKRVWNLMEDQLGRIAPNKNWIEDNGRLVPNPASVPGKYNPGNLTMAEIMGQKKFEMFPDTIPNKNGIPDLSVFSVAEAPNGMKGFDIDKFLNGELDMSKFSGRLRDMNMKSADKWLLDNRGVTVADLEKQYGFKLTWHEDINMKKCYLVPSEIHGNVGHIGAVSNYKFIFQKIPGISGLAGKKAVQFGFRFGAGRAVYAAAGN